MKILNLPNQKIKKALILLTLIGSFLTEAKAQESEIFDKLRKSVFNNQVFYYDKSSPTTTYTKAFYIYLVKPSSGSPYLKVRIQYSGNKPIYVYSYILKPDRNNSFTITPQSSQINKESDNNYDFRSWCDLLVGDNLLNTLREIVRSENPKIEYIGTKDNVEIKLYKKEIKAIENILDAYDFLMNN